LFQIIAEGGEASRDIARKALGLIDVNSWLRGDRQPRRDLSTVPSLGMCGDSSTHPRGQNRPPSGECRENHQDCA